MNTLQSTADSVSDRLERLGERAEDLAGDIVDTVAEEAPRQSPLTWALWAALLGLAAWGAWQGQWRTAFVALVTVALTMLPLVVQKWADFHLPRTLIFLVTLFAAASLVAGEVFDFYERFWWWDVALHSGSAVMFGIFGVILMMVVFKSASLRASPLMVALFALCFAVAVGAVWEIFEFAMDQLFGLNMQKSGLVDTMWDLIVDTLGGILGAGAGYAYLKYGKRGLVSGLVADMASKNAHRIDDGEVSLEALRDPTRHPA